MKNLLILVLLLIRPSYAENELLTNENTLETLVDEKKLVSFEELVSLDGNPFLLDQILALSGDKGNGGDTCENKIDIIASDIERWIHEKGYISLQLNEGITHAEYMDKMLDAIKMSRVTCIDKVITVENKEKMCVNFVDSSNTALIVCNREKILSNDVNENYKLVHHELAGVASLESGSTDGVSNYDISNQITAYLERELVTRLAVKSVEDDFTQREKANAYKALSRCSNNDVSSRKKHLNKAMLLAKKDGVSLSKSVEAYNKLSCLVYDSAMLNLIDVIFERGDTLNKIDYVTLLSELHPELRKLTVQPIGVLVDSFNDIMSAIELAGNKEDPIASFLDIFYTLNWKTKYKSSGYWYDYKDSKTDYEGGSNEKATKEGLDIYKMIWEL